MGTPPIKTNIELGGEKEYRRALSEINGGLRVLNSEMRLTSAQYAENANSVEALNKKSDVLNRTILTQKDKIELIKQALQDSARKYGEADKHTQDWQVSLNKALTEMENMERESRDTAKAIEKLTNEEQKATRETKGLGDAAGDLTQKFGISLPEGMQNSLNSFMQIDAQSLVMIGTFAALAAAIVAVTTKLVKMTIEQAKVADDILTTSTITGIGTEKLQEYAYAAELLDVSVDTLTGSQTKLIQSMGSAQRGTAETVEAFEKLGVSYTNADGSLRSAEDVFWDSIDALGQMANETERDAIAMQLMGKSAQELNPLITAGSGAMKALGQEAHEMGYILDDEALTALGALDDATRRWDNTLEGVKKQLSAQFAPAVTEALEKMTRLVKDLGEAVVKSGIVDAFGMLLNSVIDIIAPADKFGDETVPKLVRALEPLAEIMAAVANTVDFFGALFTLDFKGMKKAFGAGYTYGNGNKYQTFKEQQEQRNINSATEAAGYGEYYANGKWYPNYDEYLKTVFNDSGYSGTFDAWKVTNGYNAAGDSNWRGGLTWVGENGPELAWLPRGSGVLSAQESALASRGDTFYINISAADVREFNDIVRIAQNRRRVARMGHSG